MKHIVIVAALALSACATNREPLTGDQQLELIRRLGEYGCGGTFAIAAGAGAGQMGGEAHGSFDFRGSCPERPFIPPGLPVVVPPVG